MQRRARQTLYRDGTTRIIPKPLDFIAQLATLMPEPRVNLTHLHGVILAKFRLGSIAAVSTLKPDVSFDGGSGLSFRGRPLCQIGELVSNFPKTVCEVGERPLLKPA